MALHMWQSVLSKKISIHVLGHLSEASFILIDMACRTSNCTIFCSVFYSHALNYCKCPKTELLYNSEL